MDITGFLTGPLGLLSYAAAGAAGVAAAAAIAARKLKAKRIAEHVMPVTGRPCGVCSRVDSVAEYPIRLWDTVLMACGNCARLYRRNRAYFTSEEMFQ